MPPVFAALGAAFTGLGTATGLTAAAAVAGAGASIYGATRKAPTPPTPAPPVAAPGIPTAIQSATTPATTSSSNALADLSFLDRKKTIYASGQAPTNGDVSNFGG